MSKYLKPNLEFEKQYSELSEVGKLATDSVKTAIEAGIAEDEAFNPESYLSDRKSLIMFSETLTRAEKRENEFKDLNFFDLIKIAFNKLLKRS